jgi:hypothetical protein
MKNMMSNDNMNLKKGGFEYRTGSGSRPMTGFGISGVEPWGSGATVSVTKMDLSKTGCEDGSG